MKNLQKWAVLPLLFSFCALAEDDDAIALIPNLPSAPAFTASTVPGNGDVNPYGVAFVPGGFPSGSAIAPGDVLVSNFNNSQNQQGTGTTITRVRPSGTASVFFQGNAGLGLTTALGVLSKGFVLVGNTPTTDGTCPTVQPGFLMAIDRNGSLVKTYSDATRLDGPWDLTIHENGDQAQVFISNVLNGTVTRLDFRVPSDGTPPITMNIQTIASGYLHRCDPAALVVGPTGLTYDAQHDVLYVASTGDNAIYSVANASTATASMGKGTLVYQDNVHLHGPLALTRATNGDLITANGDAVNPDPNQPSEIVEFTTTGKFVAQFPVDNTAQGGAFGIALDSATDTLRFAAVDDITNTLSVWDIRVP